WARRCHGCASQPWVLASSRATIGKKPAATRPTNNAAIIAARLEKVIATQDKTVRLAPLKIACVRPRARSQTISNSSFPLKSAIARGMGNSALLLFSRPRLRAEQGQQQFDFFLGTDLNHLTHFNSPMPVRQKELCAGSH